MNYVYLLLCANSSYYCGWTSDLKRRVEMHQSGKGAKYTKAFRPIKLVYYECYESKHQAMKREYEIKKMTHDEKYDLIDKFEDFKHFL